MKFYCDDQENCVTDKIDQKSNDNTTYYNDLNVCRLVCNKFASLWPVPKKSTFTKTLLALSPGKISFDDNSLPKDLQPMMGEFKKIFLKTVAIECGTNCDYEFGDNTMSIRFAIDSESPELSPSTNESYTLRLRHMKSEIKVKIRAPSIFGARHGLETLSQLLVSTIENGRAGLATLARAVIEDSPDYSYRGLLLDTARNFMSIPSILRTIDGLASCKMNVFHWHITDSQSFPLEVPSLPDINRFGAYSEREIYRVTEIRDIIEYAKNRGVRVILEFDSPSHVGQGFQWGPDEGLGDLAVCIGKQPWRASCIQPPCGQFNPVNKHIYPVLEKILNVLNTLTNPNEFFHMGGDEVFFPCWNQTEEITDYLQQNGRGVSEADFVRLWSEYQDKILNIWDELKDSRESSVILWTSHLTDPETIETYLDKKRYIIQSWVRSDSEIPEILLKKGYRMIISTKNAWYLDHGFWGVTEYYNWKKVYDNKISDDSRVLGGEACMWSEYVDENSIDFKIWPRTAAVGERLWSNPKTGSLIAESRFIRHRERLLKRNMKADAVLPEFCQLNEGQCK